MSCLRDKLKMKKGMAVKLLGDYDEEVISRVYYCALGEERMSKKKADEELNRLKSDEGISEECFNEEEFFIGDGIFEAELVRIAAEEMVIVCLYKAVEISIKRMMEFSGLFSDSEIGGVFRHRELLRLLKKYVVDLEKLSGYAAYDELRRINNCIKHSGKVGDELAKVSGWNKDDKLTRLWEHYKRLEPQVSNFMKSLSEEIRKRIQN